MTNQMVCDGLQSIVGHRYQIHQKLSDKAGRQTYLAQDSEQNEQVIIKILNFDGALTWDHFKLFEREAKTLQNLSHPAIPKYLDFLDLDSGEFKGFALVQTYIKAESLETYLQSGRTFSEEEIKQLAESLLEILTYLHTHHPLVIHRDIKPSNILLGDRSGNHLGQVYLVDFGSVQNIVSKESGTITIVGSYGYIPFEQFCGQAVPASDLYSLGMTLLYLATGLHPADLPQKQGEIQIHDTGLSRPLEQWLNKMTSPRLDRRFLDAQSALKALTGDQIVASNPLKPLSSKVRLKRTHETLEIIIPKRNVFANTTSDIFLPNYLGLILVGIFIMFVAFSLYVLFIIWSVVALPSMLEDLFTPQRIKRIVLDERMMVCYLPVGSRASMRSQINRLCYACSYEFSHFWDSDGQKISRGKVKVEPKLIIYAGAEKYSIEGLTDAEYWWLGKELSDFLDLELQVIYPTPKVPSEPSCGGGC